MNTELRKRLEKAANKYANRQVNIGTQYHCRTEGFFYGAEHGYKEAITLAKEWLYSNIDLYGYTNDDDVTIIEYDALLASFEADMNKLWEGEK